MEFKEKVVADYLTDNALSLGEIANKYNIPKSCIGEWIRNKTLLEQAKKKRASYRLLKGRRKLNTIEIEEDLVMWIQKIRKLGIALN